MTALLSSSTKNAEELPEIVKAIEKKTQEADDTLAETSQDITAELK